MRYLEDFSPGQVYRFRSAPMSADSIKAFAKEWDPQRLHTDEDYATAIHGSLIASGFQTMLEVFKPVMTEMMVDVANIGGMGFDNLRWLRPVQWACSPRLSCWLTTSGTWKRIDGPAN